MTIDLLAKVRPVIAFERTLVGARIVPHRTDATKLVLKSPHPGGCHSLAHMVGVTPGPVSYGRHYFMVEVDREGFLDGLRRAVEVALAVAEPTSARVLQ